MVFRIQNRLFVLSAFVAVTLALLAFFLPALAGEEAGDKQDVFLRNSRDIDARVLLDDTGHFIGETFSIKIVVQHRSEKIDLDEGSIGSLSFAPMDVVQIRSKNESIAEGIVQYTYETSLRGIGVVPGNAYEIKPFEIKYSVISTGETGSLNLEHGIVLRFGTYYGASANGVPLRPPAAALSSNKVLKTSLFGAASFLLVLLGIFKISGLMSNRDSEESNSVVEEDTKEKIVKLLLNVKNFKNAKWLRKKDPRERMSELESAWANLGRLAAGLNSHDLWQKEDCGEWSKLKSLLELGYRKDPPTYEDVVNAGAFIESIFTPYTAK